MVGLDCATGAMSFGLCLLFFDLEREQVLDMCHVQSSCNVFKLLYLDTHLVHNSDSKQMNA